MLNMCQETKITEHTITSACVCCRDIEVRKRSFSVALGFTLAELLLPGLNVGIREDRFIRRNSISYQSHIKARKNRQVPWTRKLLRG